MNQVEPEIRVLVAEDDYLVARMICGLIETMGYRVAGEASNGCEAVSLTQALQPDVVLMDIDMPELDGLEAARLIFEQCPTPVVVLTAYETPELINQASIVGVGAYLVKPPNPREMIRAITIALARFADMISLRRMNTQIQEQYRVQEVLINQLQESLANLKTLRGLLPICMSCKKIKDDQGYWNRLETYFQNHSEVEFSHGFCPDCIKKLYPEYFDDEEKQDPFNF